MSSRLSTTVGWSVLPRSATLAPRAVMVFAVALVLVGNAAGYNVKPASADGKRARSIVLRAAETPGGWRLVHSGSREHGLISCAGYRPKTSDLVSTGYAWASFQLDRFEKMYSEARILKSEKMVRLDE